MSSTTATRQRRFWLTSSFPRTHRIARHFRRAGAAGRHRSNCRRSRSPRPPTRTGPAQNRPTMKDRPRAASCRRLRRRPARGPQPGPARTSHRKASRKARAEAAAGNSPASSARRRPLLPPKRLRIRPQQTLQEIIAQTPGVQLTSLFGGVNGAKTSVDLRGFGAFATSNTLVLINGRRLNDIDMAGVDFSTIPRDSIERIEITRGNSGAVLYGDNAVGGVINIVLKNGVGGPPVAMRAEAGVGSFNQRLGESSRPRPITDRGRRHSTATPSSPTAIAKTTRSTSATGSAISITPRPTSRPS